MSTEHDDLDEVQEPPAEAAPQPPTRRGMLPGPGLGESLLWILGYMGVQKGFAFVVELIIETWSGGNEAALIDRLGPNGVVAFGLLPILLSLLVVVPAAILRLRPDPLRKLNFALPSVTQFVILLAATAGLSLCGTGILKLLIPPFIEFLQEELPDLVEELRGFQQILWDFRNASLATLMIYLAVAPAIGEEFLFRGVIGRGLVSRWGIVAGVLITSLLFAGVHLNPPQVIGLIPLALFIHIAYLSTRSFWAPMLVHFFNNAIVAVMLRYGPEAEVNPFTIGPMSTFDWILMIGGGLVGVMGAIALWSVRTEYRNADGEVIAPAYPTVERPPRHLGLKRSAPANIVLMLVFAGVLLLETYVFWSSLEFEPAVEPAQPAEFQLTASHPVFLFSQAPHVTLAL